MYINDQLPYILPSQLGLYSINESIKTSLAISHDRLIFPNKQEKNHKIKSKTYRRWAHKQRRTLNNKGRKVLRNKMSFLENLAFVYSKRV